MGWKVILFARALKRHLSEAFCTTTRFIKKKTLQDECRVVALVILVTKQKFQPPYYQI